MDQFCNAANILHIKTYTIDREEVFMGWRSETERRRNGTNLSGLFAIALVFDAAAGRSFNGKSWVTRVADFTSYF